MMRTPMKLGVVYGDGSSTPSSLVRDSSTSSSSLRGVAVAEVAEQNSGVWRWRSFLADLVFPPPSSVRPPHGEQQRGVAARGDSAVVSSGVGGSVEARRILISFPLLGSTSDEACGRRPSLLCFPGNAAAELGGGVAGGSASTTHCFSSSIFGVSSGLQRWTYLPDPVSSAAS
nr:hypothetical protein Iba_scaffold7178CG0010 [Ipomoea batatas]